jgi:aminomethyltransferase
MTPPVLNAPAGVRTVRSRAGFAVCSPYAVVQVTGPDAAAFLDAQLPADVRGLRPGEGAYTASLDPKGRITQDLLILALGDRYWAILRRELAAAFAEKLERYHIREKVEITDREGDLDVFEIHGPAATAVLARAAGGTRVATDPYRHREIAILGRAVRFVSHPWTGDPGGHLVLDPANGDAVAEEILRAGAEEGLGLIGEDALEILRIEGGTPRFGIDVTDRTLLLELDREDMVSHTKGCYLGQETVARVHNRGRVQRVLVGLEIEGDAVPEPETLVLHDEAPAGETRSAVVSPSLERVVALAMVRRQASEPGTVVHVAMASVHGDTASRQVAATVRPLPLYRAPGPREQADALYRKGMDAFKGDRLDEALRLFERATLMNPHHYPSYESAGVCLERLGRLDEAVETMRGLTEMDPDNVMAWTNLSRYYAQQGRIEEAEKVKGHVTFLVMKGEMGKRAVERRSEEEEAARRKRMEERIALFRQVLALDTEDVVANFGLGKIYLDLERFNEAVPHFEKAVAGKRHYSMAYNHLGTCLMKLGRRQEAGRVFREGIEAATVKGDFIPKRDMERKLDELESSSETGNE